MPETLADQWAVVNRVIGYFGEHFQEAIELEAVALLMGLNGEWLDLCFDHCRGKTPFQALQHVRLGQLFESIVNQPQQTLQQQVDRCGLVSVISANHSFEDLYGIGLAPFRRVCRRAEADRQLVGSCNRHRPRH
ncbi:helix-turn-helix transcriptional regulator [Cyanobium sp. HWJ4-Hawea]|nr:helix-turn-helix transcriptional regulator [Cyanobium sp. HWJ4-Hawea]